jgi:hypothetical protein
MSDKVITVDEIADQTEFAISLVKLMDEARRSLPVVQEGVKLSLGDRAIFHKVIASKIVHGYQLEFVMNSGEVFFGFVIGLDDFVVQIYSTGHGQDFTQNGRYDFEAYEPKGGPTRHWLAINNIESVNENFFGVKHLTEAAQKALNAERRAMVKIAEKYLSPYGR